MKKKILVLVVVILLLASTIQVAFANPPRDVPASCNMLASYWPDDTGPGNANGVEDGQRGMYHVHMRKDHPRGYTKGAHHMDLITTAHCGG